MLTAPILDGATDGATRGHLLVVDSERPILELHAAALRAAGFTVDTSADGRVAAEMASGTDYDVIVCDIGLPGLDGVQLLRLVRERDLDVPVLLLTANPGIETAIQAVELGAMRYLVKPIAVAALREIVEYAARLRRIARIKRQALELLGGSGTRAGDRAGLEVSFDKAVRSIWLAFQPIVRFRDRFVFGYEALLRTREPSLPDPMALFDAAARLDRLPELGRIVRDRTAETAALDSIAGAHLFVNLHPHDLVEETLYDPAAPLSRIADRVVLEITERSSLETIRDVPARMARLRGLGFRIAIDDLGAGYAGLSSFTQLQPEAVKIDMTLVRDVHLDPMKQRLIRSVITLCGEMDMQVIAEGVETIHERDELVRLGCELFQGYLFARPGPAFPTVTW